LKKSIHGEVVSLDVNPVEIVASESGVAFWTLSLSGFVPGFDAFDAKYVKTFGEHGIFVVHIATRAAELRLERNA